VEAARATILSDVSSVFGAYGIVVDQRHLILIADFMTFHGGYRSVTLEGSEVGSPREAPNSALKGPLILCLLERHIVATARE
jgi:hypothetical protein